jgi:hypothetical protein
MRLLEQSAAAKDVAVRVEKIAQMTETNSNSEPPHQPDSRRGFESGRCA